MTWGVNDYPWRGAGGGYDRWGYAIRNCTSFANWRIVNDLGQPAVYWGNARDWPARAAAAGKGVDGTPRVHDVFVLPPGVNGALSYGHCGVVLAVGAGYFIAEDYDWAYLAYLQHRIPTNGTKFIHVLGAPAPPPPPPPAPGITLENFSVQARPSWPAPSGQTLHVRTGPGTGYGVVGNVADGAWLHCDAYAHGTVIWDPRGHNNDSRWYRIHGWGWVASALVNGDAPGSTP